MLYRIVKSRLRILHRQVRIRVSRRSNQELSEVEAKLEFAIEQYNNDNFTIALKELEELSSTNDEIRLSEQISYYSILAIIEVNEIEAINASIRFCEKYGAKKYTDVTDKVSELLMSHESYENYITYHEKGWFDTRSDKDLNLIISLIGSDQSSLALDALQHNADLVRYSSSKLNLYPF